MGLLLRRFIGSPPAQRSQAEFDLHVCDIDAEPLHRYKVDGYHPIHMGDVLNEDRYKILHKVGWGSYSTVWAARDQE